MGTGKSATGTELARLTGRPYYDLDDLIADDLGMPVPDYIRQHGEPAFRETEHRVLAAWIGQIDQPSVLSCGGGAVLSADNRVLLRSHGVVIRLNASPDTVLARVSKEQGTRPLLESPGDQRSRILELMRERESVYTGVSDFSIETDSISPGQAAQMIIDSLELTGQATV